MTLGSRVPGFGPTPNKLLFIGEAPGQEEDDKLRPFVGASGQELRRMLRTIGLAMDECRLENVFDRRPPSNDLAAGYGVDRADPRACVDLGPLTPKPVTFLNREHVGQIARLYAEIERCAPNVIVPLGNTACWALGLGHGIAALRGTVHQVEIAGRLYKALPTYHPSAILRQWDLRTIAVTDLEKARQESSSPDLNFDNTELWLEPSLADHEEFGRQFMSHATRCAFDIETKQGQITCLSFAPSPDHCIVVPFWVEGPDPHYWPTPTEEGRAWRWVQRWVEDGSLTKITQNGVYDMTYMVSTMKMRPQGFTEDTMLQSHSLNSEMQKGLGFLGSIYCNTPSWKSMRRFKKEEQLKKDD